MAGTRPVSSRWRSRGFVRHVHKCAQWNICSLASSARSLQATHSCCHRLRHTAQRPLGDPESELRFDQGDGGNVEGNEQQRSSVDAPAEV